MRDNFMELIPAHRTYINYLINKEIVDQYVVSMESNQVWITINAESKEKVEEYMEKSPLAPFWNFTICELFVWDGQHYRLPAMQPN